MSPISRWRTHGGPRAQGRVDLPGLNFGDVMLGQTGQGGEAACVRPAFWRASRSILPKMNPPFGAFPRLPPVTQCARPPCAAKRQRFTRSYAGQPTASASVPRSRRLGSPHPLSICASVVSAMPAWAANSCCVRPADTRAALRFRPSTARMSVLDSVLARLAGPRATASSSPGENSEPIPCVRRGCAAHHT